MIFITKSLDLLDDTKLYAINTLWADFSEIFDEAIKQQFSVLLNQFFENAGNIRLNSIRLVELLVRDLYSFLHREQKFSICRHCGTPGAKKFGQNLFGIMNRC